MTTDEIQGLFESRSAAWEILPKESPPQEEWSSWDPSLKLSARLRLDDGWMHFRLVRFGDDDHAKFFSSWVRVLKDGQELHLGIQRGDTAYVSSALDFAESGELPEPAPLG